jgi:hypothetical protein
VGLSANRRSTSAAASLIRFWWTRRFVQGIGAVLYAEGTYSEDANLQNGTMANYLVPMSDAMPDIVVAHISCSAVEHTRNGC